MAYTATFTIDGLPSGKTITATGMSGNAEGVTFTGCPAGTGTTDVGTKAGIRVISDTSIYVPYGLMSTFSVA